MAQFGTEFSTGKLGLEPHCKVKHQQMQRYLGHVIVWIIVWRLSKDVFNK